MKRILFMLMGIVAVLTVIMAFSGGKNDCENIIDIRPDTE